MIDNFVSPQPLSKNMTILNKKCQKLPSIKQKINYPNRQISAHAYNFVSEWNKKISNAQLQKKIERIKIQCSKKKQQRIGKQQNYIQSQNMFKKMCKSEVNDPNSYKKLNQFHIVQNSEKDTYIDDQNSQFLSQIQSELDLNQQVNTEFTFIDQPGTVILQKSIYKQRPLTIFFQYPKQAQLHRQKHNTITLTKAEKQELVLNYKINGNSYRCIDNSLKVAGFTQTSQSKYLIYFDIRANNVKYKLKKLQQFQKINHFSGCWQIGRKDKMWLNLIKKIRLFPKSYDFIPKTYLFSYDYQRFKKIRQNAKKDQLWIIKPADNACGRGIRVINKYSKVKYKLNYLASEYIKNPHLIHGYKYDLRIYILVTNFDPLKIYMYDEGIVRFATQKFCLSKSEIHKRFIHLTNYSVNKRSSKYKKNNGTINNNNQFTYKWSLRQLKDYFTYIGISYQSINQKIVDIIIKSLIAHEGYMMDIITKTYQHRNNSFQLYGFDILLDDALKPWLIEINVCPSLASSSVLDRRIKHRVYSDILNLIGIKPIKKSEFKKIKQVEKYKYIYGRLIADLQNITYQNCVEILHPYSWQVLFEFAEQNNRKGKFHCIFPNRLNCQKYNQYFQVTRYNNLLLSKWLLSEKDFLQRIFPKQS